MVLYSGELLKVQHSRSMDIFCKDSFYWFEGASGQIKQYYKMGFGFVSAVLAGARTIALCTHLRVY